MRTTKPQEVTEKQFTAQVIELAKLLSYQVYHPFLSIRSEPGWPDLSLAREERDGTARLIFLELKSERGKLTEAQEKWLALLGKVPEVVARAARPSDWDEIVELLSGRLKQQKEERNEIDANHHHTT